MNHDRQPGEELTTRNLYVASELKGGLMGTGLTEVMSALSEREENLKKWLADHADEIGPQAHLEANSREQVYWRYGYLIALRDALNLLQKTLTANQTPCSAGTSN